MTEIRILIRLPKDRRQPGTLRLVDARAPADRPEDAQPSALTGELFSCPCLGKADGQKALEAGNPTRDPVLPFGDTPTGLYAAASAVEHDPPHPRMGRWSIALHGLAGDALAAMQARTGLAIHAGRGDGALIPTYGCVRLRDASIAALVQFLAGRPAEIAIDETQEGA